MKATSFAIGSFATSLGLHPWAYTVDTYTDGAGRFLDWHKGERLLGLPKSALLFSEYDAEQQRLALWSFPAPQDLGEAMAVARSVGWLKT